MYTGPVCQKILETKSSLTSLECDNIPSQISSQPVKIHNDKLTEVDVMMHYLYLFFSQASERAGFLNPRI